MWNRVEVKARATGRWWPGTGALGILTFFSDGSQSQGTWPATITTCNLCRPPLWLPLGDLPWTWRKADWVPWLAGCASATPDLLENVDIFPHYNSQSVKTASVKVWNPGLPTHARPSLPGHSPARSAFHHLLLWAEATTLHGQVVWPGSAAARLTGPAQAPCVYEQWRLVHLHSGAGSWDGLFPQQLLLTLHTPLTATCPTQAGAAAAVGRSNGWCSRWWE